MTDLFDWPVHPGAAAYRMMTDEELAELAASIKANGLLYPIVLGQWKDDHDEDVKGVIDGRNRLRACEIAEVKPEFKELNGHDDPRAFIVSVNGNRRNISKGQQALAYAINYPKPEKGGRGKKNSVESTEFSDERISHARTVLREAPDLVEDIRDGILGLDAAYSQALARKRAKEWRTDGLRRLREVAPDLAGRVEAGELTLDEARTLLQDRDQRQRAIRQTVFQTLAEFVRYAKALADDPTFSEVPGWLDVDEFETEFRQYFKAGTAELIELARGLNEGAAVVARIVAEVTKKGSKR